MFQLLDIPKPQKRLGRSFLELNGCGTLAHWGLLEWKVEIQHWTGYQYLHVGYFRTKKWLHAACGMSKRREIVKTGKNNFISSNEKVSSNLSNYYIHDYTYKYVWIYSLYMTILSLPPKKRRSWLAEAPRRCACRSPENLRAAKHFARPARHLPSSRTKASGPPGATRKGIRRPTRHPESPKISKCYGHSKMRYLWKI